MDPQDLSISIDKHELDSSIQQDSKLESILSENKKQELDIFEKQIFYSERDYLLTRSMNLIGKKCLIKGSNNIEIFDHAILNQRIILRGDLMKISIGRYTTLGEAVIVKPTSKKSGGTIKYIPIEIGDYVFIEKNCILHAMKIGSCVKIGKDCIVGPRVVIGESSILLEGSIVPPDSYIAPFSVYGGKPAIYLGELPESISIIQKEACISYYNNFTKKT